VAESAPNRRKHILYITEYFHTPQEGGLLRTWATAKHLISEGYRVTVVAPASHHMSGETPEELRGKLFNRYTVDGIDVVKVYGLGDNRASRVRRALHLLVYPSLALVAALRVRKPDVVIASTPPTFLLPVGYAVSLIKRAAYGVEMRDAWLEFIEARGLLPRPALKVLFWLQRAMLRRAKRVIAVTPGIQEIAKEAVQDPSKVTIVLNGFEEDVHEAIPEAQLAALRAEHGLDDKFVVIYTGTLGLARDHDIFARSARLLRRAPDIRFVFVGEGEKRADLMELCKDLDNCVFVPLQPRTMIPLFLAASHVAINSIRKNDNLESSLSNKVFDYMGNHVPVVWAGEGDTSDFIERSGGGIVVEPEDAEAMAAAIERLHEDPALRERMADDGQRYVIEGFTRKVAMERLSKTMSELLEP
jgi:glycosyltransferase involved in cell wall biosynthesis